MNIKHAVSYLLQGTAPNQEIENIRYMLNKGNIPAFKEDPTFSLTKLEAELQEHEQELWVNFINENSPRKMPLPVPEADSIVLNLVDIARLYIFHNASDSNRVTQALRMDIWGLAEYMKFVGSTCIEHNGRLII